MISGDYEIRDVVVKGEALHFKRVYARGKQVGIIVGANPTEILFTAPIVNHVCDGLMEWFSGIIGEEGVERHPAIMLPEVDHEPEEDFEI